ncbi:hypothetical protein SteCoe_30110 [Stentor coeruleus]|uniref:Tubulin/FtsZ GTPase domain-containing protein n=1 Tax=Stentor coeruleus TaxID=5963 RepID=A0A1R2B4E6_9CILI|nr:hypothetical protein SteCoe_30110 [Stentor coeruleus]
MSEILSISIGNTGTKIGLDFWELLCLEENIDPCGKFNSLHQNWKFGYHKFFNEVSSQTYTPRALFIDTDPNIFSIVNTKNLFNPAYTISGIKSLNGNFAKGISSKYYNNESITLIDASLENLRKLAENSNSFEGFMITHSVAGGTGSSLTSILLEKLSEEYPKKIKSTISVMPSENNNEYLESYNVMHCMNSLIENADITFSYDNNALKDICKRTFRTENIGFDNYNRLIAHAMSSITCCIRNDGCLNESLNANLNNHISYSPMHFLITSQFPLWPPEKTCLPPEYSDYDITFEVFNSDYFMIKCDITFQKLMQTSLLYRGNCIPRNISLALNNVKFDMKIEFVEWYSRGIMCGIDHDIPEIFPKSELVKITKHAFLCFNSCAISDMFIKLLSEFDISYANKICLDRIHQEGFDDEVLINDRERVKMLLEDYGEAAKEYQYDESEV